MSDNEAVIDIKADASALKEQLAGIHDLLENFGSKVKGVFEAIGAIWLVNKASEMTMDFLHAAEATEVLNIRLKTLNETSGVSGRTFEGLSADAKKLADTLGIEDEAVKSAQISLLKYQQVRGEQFQEALKQAGNLAAATGQSIDSAAHMIGRALENPEHGFMMLRRAGIFFTQSQQDVIKAMMQTGDVAKAQDLILQKLEGTFGGVGKAVGGTFQAAMTRLRESFEDTKKGIGALIAPIATELVNGFVKLMGSTDALIERLRPVATWFAELAHTAVQYIPVVQDAFVQFGAVASGLAQDVWDAFKAMFDNIKAYVGPSIGSVKDSFKSAWTFVKTLFIDVVSGMETGIREWRKIVTIAVLEVKLAFLEAWGTIEQLWTKDLPNWMKAITPIWKAVWDQVSQYATDAFDTMLENLGKAWDFWITGLQEKAGKLAVDTGTALVSNLANAAGKLAAPALGVMPGDMKDWDKAVDKVTNEWLNAHVGADVDSRPKPTFTPLPSLPNVKLPQFQAPTHEERQETPAERDLREAIKAMGKDVAGTFSEMKKRNERLFANALKEDPNAKPAGPDPNVKPIDKAREDIRSPMKAAFEDVQALNKRIQAAAAGENADPVVKAIHEQTRHQNQFLNKQEQDRREAIRWLRTAHDDFGDLNKNLAANGALN